MRPPAGTVLAATGEEAFAATVPLVVALVEVVLALRLHLTALRFFHFYSALALVQLPGRAPLKSMPLHTMRPTRISVQGRGRGAHAAGAGRGRFRTFGRSVESLLRRAAGTAAASASRARRRRAAGPVVILCAAFQIRQAGSERAREPRRVRWCCCFVDSSLAGGAADTACWRAASRRPRGRRPRYRCARSRPSSGTDSYRLRASASFVASCGRARTRARRTVIARAAGRSQQAVAACLARRGGSAAAGR